MHSGNRDTFGRVRIFARRPAAGMMLERYLNQVHENMAEQVAHVPIAFCRLQKPRYGEQVHESLQHDERKRAATKQVLTGS